MSSNSDVLTTFDGHHVAERYRRQYNARFVFDLDAMMKRDATLAVDQVAHQRPGLVQRPCLRGLKVRQLDAFQVGTVEIVVKMKIVFRHRDQERFRARIVPVSDLG